MNADKVKCGYLNSAWFNVISLVYRTQVYLGSDLWVASVSK